MVKTSARNHLSGTIMKIEQGAVGDEVSILLDSSGTQVVALVSRARTKILGLELGMKVVVIVMAHDVILMTDPDGVVFSTRNQLKGTVLQITKSEVVADVRVRLDGGSSLAALIPAESVRELKLEPGSSVTVIVRESTVSLGVKKGA